MKRSIETIMLWLAFTTALYASEGELLDYTQHLTISDGLAHSGVTSILEDSRGYIWIGTYDGLNRYDGYSFRVFKNTIDRSLFYSNRIRTVEEDSKGNIWIGTDDGITVYHYLTEEFKCIYSNKNYEKGSKGPIVRDVIENQETGMFLCATEDAGVLVFNSDYTFSRQYVPQDMATGLSVLFHEGLSLNDFQYVFATNAGLLLLDMEKGRFRLAVADQIGSCNHVAEAGENLLLVSSNAGIDVVEYGKSEDTLKFDHRSGHLRSYLFKCASVDPQGNLWLGRIRDGVMLIKDLAALLESRPYSAEFYTVPSGLLRTSCISASENTGCWVGTFNKGIYRFALKENPFKSYNSSMDYANGLHSNQISRVMPVDNNRIMVSALMGGMALFNTAEPAFDPVPFQLPESSRRNVGVLFNDSRNDIWFNLSGNQELARIRAGKHIPETVLFEHDGESWPRTARDIVEDRFGNLWIATYATVFRVKFDDAGNIIQTESMSQHPDLVPGSLSLVRSMYADPLHDFIWVGTDTDGLFRIGFDGQQPLSAGEVRQYKMDVDNTHSISSDFVSTIIRLPNEEMWIGTEGGGICKVIDSNTDPKFIPFTEKNGLSNNVVKSIRYDNDHNLWVSTNIGLSRFNTKDYTFRIFGKKDGLPFEDFTYTSARLGNGKFVFSGIDGFLYFDPELVPGEEPTPAVHFDNLRIFNNLILPGDTIGNRVLLARTLAETGEITLKHNEDVFSIELTSLHYSNPDNHFIRYQLLPVNEEWVEVPSGQRTIYYNGLRPGEYELNVMASNSLKEWSVPESMRIVILPPFRTTKLAFVLYALSLLLIGYVVVFFILRIKTLNYKLQIEKLEIDKVKEVNAAKLRFFSNISHEIKTPLTLISGPIDMLARRFTGNRDIRDKIQIVQRQSKKISQLVDQVHDFQRAEANLLKMNSNRFNFDVFIRELVSDYEYLAHHDKKILEAKGGVDPIFVLADKDKLGKIFNNLINNAFKYTRPGDSITVEYWREDRDLVVSVKDTGKGIDSEDLPHIFERFYQTRKKPEEYAGGSGIGLAFSKRLVEMHYGYIGAESEVDRGTTILVRLPVVKTRYSKDQQAMEQEILSAEKDYVSADQMIREERQDQVEVSGEFKDSLLYIAEDNPDMRSFVSGILSAHYEVRDFTNGQECLDAMEEEWPDLVVTDVLMPELNGFELCKNIKSDIKTSHIPIIMLTACTANDDQIKGIMDGADAYIFKPFDVKHLVASVESMLRNRQQLRERFKISIPLTLEKGKHNSNDSAFLGKLYTLMEENLDNHDLDLDGFARELYLNRSHFYQKVKALTNQTPFELLKTLRLEKAAHLLVHERVSVTEAYMRTGFKSRSHFSKLFKAKYEVTPGQYASDILQKVNE